MIAGKTIKDAISWRAGAQEPLGLVATMGCLHEGHASLIRRAKKECASVAVSIFVNPTQFGPDEDLKRYPRPTESDLALLKSLEVDFAWAPDANEIYPPGFQSFVTVQNLSLIGEGASRPGHFRGVATIVAKLLNIFKPQRAYFGQKDTQQAALIRQMTRDLNFPAQVIICPTIREQDGLALSSRNSYLSGEERRCARVLYLSLREAYRIHEKGERTASILKEAMREKIAAEPGARTDYISIVNPGTFMELDRIQEDALFLLAVYIGTTRLIDNFALEKGRWQTGITLNQEEKADVSQYAQI